MSTDKHTPGEWEVFYDNEDFPNQGCIYGMDGDRNSRIIAVIDRSDETDLANAARICEAVNNYDEMKECLQAFHDMFIHVEGETKKNKIKTDMIAYCDEVKKALNKSFQLLTYKLK